MPFLLFAAFLALFSLSSCAVADAEDFVAKLSEACEVAGKSEGSQASWRKADQTLARGLADPRFASMGAVERGQFHSCAGWGALRLGDQARARDQFEKATQLDPEVSQNWIVLADLETKLRRYDKAAMALARYLQRQPERLPELERAVFETVSRYEPGSEGHLALLQWLSEQDWRPNDPRASDPWLKLALERIHRGEPEAARAAIARIKVPDTLVRLRSDKRFDGLYDPDAKEFDPVAAANTRVDDIKVKAVLEPTKLRILVELSRAMLAVGMDAEVLDMTERLSMYVAEHPGERKYVDLDEMPRILESRSSALFNLGKMDEGLAVMVKAAGSDVDGKPNVNQALDLAGVYCRFGRGEDVLRAAAKVDKNMSGYGLMVKAYMEQCGALLTKDGKKAAAALDYMREHRADGEGLYLEALVRADRLEEASRIVIARLESEAQRTEILFELQDFQEPKVAPPVLPWAGRWDTIAQREDVRAALAKVGRIQRYEYFGD